MHVDTNKNRGITGKNFPLNFLLKMPTKTMIVMRKEYGR
jgi:hypothetical protein